MINIGSERMSEAFRAAGRQPNWATRAAVITFLLVIAIPIFLLLLLATFAAAVVFMVLAGINWLLGRTPGRRPPEAGRRNVRVINRD